MFWLTKDYLVFETWLEYVNSCWFGPNELPDGVEVIILNDEPVALDVGDDISF